MLSEGLMNVDRASDWRFVDSDREPIGSVD